MTMGNSIYRIHRDINRPIEFHGLQSQYIGLLALGFVLLLGLILVLYYSGTPRIMSLSGLVLIGLAWTAQVQKWSKRYGRHGLLKSYARRKLPSSVRLRDRRTFIFIKPLEGKKWT